MSERDTDKLLPTILVVEDDDAFRAILVQALAARGYEVRGAASQAAIASSVNKSVV